jgi:hypothetical protein
MQKVSFGVAILSTEIHSLQLRPRRGQLLYDELGSPQWQIGAPRLLEIPEDMQKKYGFAPLADANSATKQLIFGGNANKFYKIRLKSASRTSRTSTPRLRSNTRTSATATFAPPKCQRLRRRSRRRLVRCLMTNQEFQFVARQEKGRRALRRRPLLATAGSWVRFHCIPLSYIEFDS